jgi:hypothetical protein
MDYEEALEASQDSSWIRRAEAAEVLAQFTDDSAYTLMLRLLTDCQDTGVGLRAVEALIRRGDLYGASLAFAGFALADEQGGSHIGWAISRGWYETRFDIERFAELILAAETPVARQGVREYLEWHDIFRSNDEGTRNWYRTNRT